MDVDMQTISSDESGYESAVSNPTTADSHHRRPGENVQTVYSNTDVLFAVDETPSDADPMQVTGNSSRSESPMLLVGRFIPSPSPIPLQVTRNSPRTESPLPLVGRFVSSPSPMPIIPPSTPSTPLTPPYFQPEFVQPTIDAHLASLQSPPPPSTPPYLFSARSPQPMTGIDDSGRSISARSSPPRLPQPSPELFTPKPRPAPVAILPPLSPPLVGLSTPKAGPALVATTSIGIPPSHVPVTSWSSRAPATRISVPVRRSPRPSGSIQTLTSSQSPAQPRRSPSVAISASSSLPPSRTPTSTSSSPSPDTPRTKKRPGDRLSDKCRHEEVDYSLSLRQEVRKKEGTIMRLRSRVKEQNGAIQQERASLQQHYSMLYDNAVHNARKELEHDAQQRLNDKEAEIELLRSQINMYKQDREELQAQIYSNQDLTKQHKVEMDALRQRLESDMHAQIGEVVRQSNSNFANALEQQEKEMQAKSTEYERRMQRETERMVAERERELAAMEQRHTHINPSTGVSRVDLPPSNMQDRNTRLTPSLDAIRRIKNSRGASHRTRLIGVSTGPSNEPQQAPSSGHHPSQPPSSERMSPATPAPEFQQRQSRDHTHSEPAEEMSDDMAAPTGNGLTTREIAKVVEVTLRNFLDSGLHSGSLRPDKRPPRRRRAEDLEVERERATEPSHDRDFVLREVRQLFKRKFEISQDVDFIATDPAPASDVDAFEKEDGDGPDAANLAFDLRHSYNSPWNTAVIELLLQEFQTTAKEDQWPVQKTDNYIRTLLKNRYKKLRMAWFKGQPKLTRNGVLETPGEVEARLVDEMSKHGKASRQGNRRRNKYDRRVTTLGHIIKCKHETRAEDIQAWEWLSQLIKTLG